MQRTVPHVVIALPVYNGAGFVGQAIKSALAQDYERLTVLVVDNASTDETPTILSQFNDKRLVVKRFEEFLPIAANWNRALQEADGDMVMIMSADNVMLPGSIAALANALAAKPSCGLAIGQTKYVVAKGHKRKVLYPFRRLAPGVITDLEAHLLRYGYNFSINAVMFRKSLPDLRIRPEAGYGCDLDLLLRLGQSGTKGLSVNHTAIEWLDHPETLTFTQYDRVWEALIKVYVEAAPSSPRQRAFRNRIGRMTTWECMLLLRSRNRAQAAQRMNTYGPHTSLAWRLLLKLMYAVPKAHLLPQFVRWVGSEDGPLAARLRTEETLQQSGKGP